MPDYHDRIRALRALGAEGSGATEPERKLANDKADELEAKYGKTVPEYSTPTDHTTTTSRDGRSWESWRFEDGIFSPFARPPGYTPRPPPPPSGGWEAYMQDLLARQHMWNKPPDSDDLIAEEWKYEEEPEDEDYGYDLYEGEEPFNG